MEFVKQSINETDEIIAEVIDANMLELETMIKNQEKRLKWIEDEVERQLETLTKNHERLDDCFTDHQISRIRK